MTLCLLLKFAKFCPARNINIHIFSDKILENSKVWTFRNFPVTLYCNAHEKKRITIQVFLVNFRPSFRYCRMQILWSFQKLRASPSWNPHQGSAMDLLGTCSRPRKKTSTSAIDQAASPAASLSPRHWPVT